jgi:hypothetical protein
MLAETVPDPRLGVYKSLNAPDGPETWFSRWSNTDWDNLDGRGEDRRWYQATDPLFTRRTSEPVREIRAGESACESARALVEDRYYICGRCSRLCC